MFQFLFKYPGPVFTKGRLVLLSAWPPWLLPVLMVAGAAGLALLVRWRLRHSEAKLRGLRVGAIWATQSALLALLLLLLWQPAVIVAELGSHQNIIAVVVDDSRSMGIADSDGKTREAAAIAALDGGVLAGLRQRFQTRIYRLGREITPVESPDDVAPGDVATHLDQSLEQLARETEDLPVGAILGGLIGWRWAFGAAALVSILLVLLQAFFVPPLPVRNAVRWHELLAVWRIPQARLGLLMAFALFFGQFFAYTYIAPFLGQVSRLSDTAIGVVLLLMGVTGFFGTLLGGRTASRDARRDIGEAALLIAVPVLLLVLAGS